MLTYKVNAGGICTGRTTADDREVALMHKADGAMGTEGARAAQTILGSGGADSTPLRRAKRPRVRGKMTASSLHGQPPNSVRW